MISKFILTLIFILTVSIEGYSQTFTHSGTIRTEGNVGVPGVTVNLYKRTTPTITGFTQQTNYNGHSYYRSTGSMTWTNAKAACENMGGHLATISNSAENNFLFNTWPSGWIGLYQDKTGAFYSEPNGGWRWTENDIDDYVHNYDSKNYTTTLVDNVGSANAVMYNGPTHTTMGGNYVQFDGTNDYAITGNLASSFPNAQTTQTLQLLCYPQSTGILVTELGVGNTNSGWHAAVMEITTSGTLKVGFWNGSDISSISSSITMNTWHLITVTYDGISLKGYLDGTYFGVLTFNREVPHSNSGNGMYYALAKSDATNMGNGTYGQYRLGYFRVFNRVLSDDEVDRAWMHISYRYGRMKYTNWNGGEPNNSGSEDYIHFVTNGRWNDLPNTSLPYVLEFDYIVTTTPWVLETTSITNSNGQYSFSLPTNPSVEWYIEIIVPTVSSNLTLSDLEGPSDVLLEKTSLKSYHYHKCDLNGDNLITVGDVCLIVDRLNGIASFTKNTLLFTNSQWTTLNNSKSDLRASIPGINTIYTFTPASGGSSNFYLLSPGYNDQSTLNY